jgi:cysteine desulfurase/selenocysteine lyase
MNNFSQYRKDFPFYDHNPETIYLDSTATSLKPRSVIEKLTGYYEKYSANVERGLYKQAVESSDLYWQTRELTAKFIGASEYDEVIFTRNTTESINLIAFTLGYSMLSEGDEVAVTVMDHHSNFVPWQILSQKTKTAFRVIDITEQGQLSLYQKDEQVVDFPLLKQYITPQTKLLAIPYVSNMLGTINPVAEIIAASKKINPDIITVVDAAQAVPHMVIDAETMGCDFLAFSSHKMCGPTGVGVLWGKRSLLEQMSPYQYGGEMIDYVSIEETTFKQPPARFEAGTPHIAGVIGLGESVRYLQQIGMNQIREHEKQLTDYALKRINEEFGEEIQVYGPSDPEHRGGVLSFTFRDYHPHDIAHILDEQDICIRAGHHCTQPLHRRLGLNATSRMSFYLYNTEEDVEAVIKGLKQVQKILNPKS